jgi:hypothetical protein
LVRTIRLLAAFAVLGIAAMSTSAQNFWKPHLPHLPKPNLGSARLEDASIYYAGGTTRDSSVGLLNTLGGGTLYGTPSLGGFFSTIGGDVIFFHGLGVGGEVSFRNGRTAYAGLTYRPSFYDVNAVYKRSFGSFAVEGQGGAGRANFNFYYTPTFCAGFPQGCQSTTGQAAGANYLEWHFAGGVRYYAYKGLFVRPTIELRRVDRLTYFSSQWIPQYSVAIGYTIQRNSEN